MKVEQHESLTPSSSDISMFATHRRWAHDMSPAEQQTSVS